MRFLFSQRHLWMDVSQRPPGPGEYLVSDGIDTWVVVRETNAMFAWFTRVKWWRKVL